MLSRTIIRHLILVSYTFNISLLPIITLQKRYYNIYYNVIRYFKTHSGFNLTEHRTI